MNHKQYYDFWLEHKLPEHLAEGSNAEEFTFWALGIDLKEPEVEKLLNKKFTYQDIYILYLIDFCTTVGFRLTPHLIRILNTVDVSKNSSIQLALKMNQEIRKGENTQQPF